MICHSLFKWLLVISPMQFFLHLGSCLRLTFLSFHLLLNFIALINFLFLFWSVFLVGFPYLCSGPWRSPEIRLGAPVVSRTFVNRPASLPGSWGRASAFWACVGLCKANQRAHSRPSRAPWAPRPGFPCSAVSVSSAPRSLRLSNTTDHLLFILHFE